MKSLLNISKNKRTIIYQNGGRMIPKGENGLDTYFYRGSDGRIYGAKSNKNYSTDEALSWLENHKINIDGINRDNFGTYLHRKSTSSFPLERSYFYSPDTYFEQLSKINTNKVTDTNKVTNKNNISYLNGMRGYTGTMSNGNLATYYLGNQGELYRMDGNRRLRINGNNDGKLKIDGLLFIDGKWLLSTEQLGEITEKINTNQHRGKDWNAIAVNNGFTDSDEVRKWLEWWNKTHENNIIVADSKFGDISKTKFGGMTDKDKADWNAYKTNGYQTPVVKEEETLVPQYEDYIRPFENGNSIYGGNANFKWGDQAYLGTLSAGERKTARQNGFNLIDVKSGTVVNTQGMSRGDLRRLNRSNQQALKLRNSKFNQGLYGEGDVNTVINDALRLQSGYQGNITFNAPSAEKRLILNPPLEILVLNTSYTPVRNVQAPTYEDTGEGFYTPEDIYLQKTNYLTNAKFGGKFKSRIEVV